VAVGTGFGLHIVDGIRPEQQHIAGALDMVSPWIFSLAVAPPLVWAIANNFGTGTAHLSIVDAGVLDHPTELGQRPIDPHGHELRARGTHAWLTADGVAQVYRAPDRTVGPATPTPAGTPITPTATPSPASSQTPPVATPTDAPTPAPGNVWLPVVVAGTNIR
jgi:hypothetical protein